MTSISVQDPDSVAGSLSGAPAGRADVEGSLAGAVAPLALPSRRAVVATIVVGVALVALATQFDVRIATWVRDNPISFEAKQILEVTRWPGHFVFTMVVAGLIVIRSRDPLIGRARAIVLLVAAGAPGLASTVLKWGVGRTRPFRGALAFDLTPLRDGAFGVFYQKNLSFPSGDATLAFATAATLALLFPRWRPLFWLWACVVCVARVLQGAHYPSDVLAGAAVGTLLAWASIALIFRASRPAGA